MADDEIKVKKERDPIMVVCFIVFILTVCAISGATAYNNFVKADNSIAVNGNTVSVDYTGTYYDYFGENNSVVFDTSRWSVADNDKILKSNDFTARSKSNYSPLSFTVGGTSVLTGFGNAVIGHKVGDVIRVVLPSGEGYNAASTKVSAPSSYTMDVTETLTAAQFNSLYDFSLKGFKEIEKSVYGWPAVASYNSVNNTVTMNYQPAAGTSYKIIDNDFGTVELNVTSVSGGKITYTYAISDYTVVSTEGTEKFIQMIKVDLGTEKFYIVSVVDADNNGVIDGFFYKTAEERYNQDLYFEIKIVSIS
ncbi:MAG: FKBP-type peptidyl-prolyl cis-trans isomerase [Candidatus Methanoplasma sp.]|jgi:FKBP-type peptidyl-prolyl cis-trans isomerase 2|nr:FKBP-type peptidyl-prolyl cis-trans isomerase [Candidatus Methanoplasma sp.]